MGKLRHLYFHPRSAEFGHTTGRPQPEPKDKQQKIFAVSTTRYGKADIFTYDDDEQGRRELSNLIRSEEVLMVIKGSQVSFRTASVVELTVGGTTIQDVLPTSGD